MAEDFELHPIAIEETLIRLREGLIREYVARYAPRHRRSEMRTRNLAKIQRWIAGLDNLLAQIAEVNRTVIPTIEADVGITLRDPNLILRVLMDSSVKGLFLRILTEFPEEELPVPPKDLYTLYTMPDDADALALIGDVTMRLKVLPGLEKGRTNSAEYISTADDRSLSAADVAALCDRWGLSEHVIGICRRCPPAEKDVQQEKWILASAVLGVLYRDGGLEALRQVAPLLQNGSRDPR